ncbi:MAG: AAA family ATPase, partial [Saprospiraceae bacterium]|nr:AAA family ATPase [Saprospiraceae bacterium]
MADENLEILSAPHAQTLIAVQAAQDGSGKMVLKSLQQGFVAYREIQLHNEYGICHGIDNPSLRKAHRLDRVDGKPTLFLEYIPGSTWDEAYHNSDQEIETFIRLAIAVSKAVHEVHGCGIVHRDINPRNIIVSEELDRATVIDFGISRKMGSKIVHQGSPDLLEGTLSYLSPEQTGRMNRRVDARSDLYSLGVSFFQLLTGALPFVEKNNLEIVHAHLAKAAPHPQSVAPSVPKVLGDIVMKLMAKDSSERYQSAAGLVEDLNTALTQWTETGAIEEFILGQNDHSGSLHLPEKLYGREAELEVLNTAYQEVLHGRNQLLLVGGYSGIGKTVLVEEIHRPVASTNGIFLSGKFGQYQRNIPYHAIRESLEKLYQLLLTASPQARQEFVEAFLKEVGEDREALFDLMPQLEAMVPKSEQPLPELDAQDAITRLQVVFRRFLKFLSGRQPLVLFLDDVQWADGASLALLKSMVLDEGLTNVLIVAAYRDNEVGAGHPLPMLVEEIKSQGALVNSITLSPLPLEQVGAFVQDTFEWGQEQAQPLTEIIFSKTHGNAFFVKEFIREIYEKELVKFDFKSLEWKLDLEGVRKQKITENVVDLLTARMEEMDPDMQECLKLGSCIGSSFSLNQVAHLRKVNRQEVFTQLWPAIEDELIRLLDHRHELMSGTLNLKDHEDMMFRFGHDRIQQAAYQALGEDGRVQAHAEMGLMLMEQRSEPHDIFDVVRHLNQGMEGLHSISKDQLLALNLEAAELARATAAFESALDYVHAMEKIRETHPQNTANPREQRVAAEVYFLNGQLERSEELLRICLETTDEVTERVDLYYLLMLRQSLSSQYVEAIQTARTALELLDFDLPAEDLETHIGTHLGWIMQYFQKHGIEGIFSNQELTDPRWVATIKILDNLSMPTYVSGQVNLWILHVLLKVRLSIERGIRPESGYAFSELGLILCIQNLFAPAFASADLSARMAEHFASTSLRHKGRSLHLIANYISPWRMHIRDTAPINNESHLASVASGEMIFTGYTIFHPAYNQFYVSEESMDVLKGRLPEAIAFAKGIKHDLAYNSLRGMDLLIDALQQPKANAVTFGTKELTESQLLAEASQGKDYYSICIWYIFKAKVLYMLEQFEAAREAIENIGEMVAVVSGNSVSLSTLNFTKSLLLIETLREAPDDQEAMQELEANQEVLKAWADVCPANISHKYLLVEALKESLVGDGEHVIKMFHDAAKAAADDGFRMEEALCHMKMAEEFDRRGFNEYAQLHGQKAQAQYAFLSAHSLVDLLQTKYSTHSKTTSYAGSSLSANTTQISGLYDLDLQSILKASEALSSELELDRLIASLIEIVMENAGAPKGGLILLDDDKEWSVAALASIQDGQLIYDDLSGADKQVPKSIIHYVLQSEAELVLDQAAEDERFRNDPYIEASNSQSILSIPLISSG